VGFKKTGFQKNKAIFFTSGLALLTITTLLVFFNSKSFDPAQSESRVPIKLHDTTSIVEQVEESPEQDAPFSVSAESVKASLYRLGNEVDLHAQGVVRPLTSEEQAIAESLPTTSVYRRFSLGKLDWNALHLLKRGDVISLPLPGGVEARAVINLVDSKPGEPYGIAGQMVSGLQGAFSLVQDPLVGTRGFILPDHDGLAFKISEENGDVFLDEVPKGAILCQGMPIAPGQTVRSLMAANPPVPDLDSRLGAAGTLYLDFDGETVTDPSWNAGLPIVAAPPVFSNADSIIRVWREVADDFSVFNVNVTTALARYHASPPGQRMRIIITPTSSWIPGAGGVAFLNSFQWGGTTPCWAFNGAGNLDSQANSHMCAMTISHELGHTFGLLHDGLLPATPNDGVGSTAKEPYYDGHQTPLGKWGPIMGAPFDAPIVQWAKNEYRGLHFSDPSDLNFYQGNNPEDDIAIIAGPANKVGFVADDFSSNIETCGEIPQSTPGVIHLTNGLIHNDGDTDYFRISLEQGVLQIQASNSPSYPKIKIQLALINPDRISTNTVSSPSNSLIASISTNLPAGTYFLRVEGVGTTTSTNTTNGFVGYGSIGQYQLRGSFRYLPHPPGDFFAEPLALPNLGTFTSSNSILGADAEPAERGFVTGRARTTLWYRWTAPGSGIMNLNTAGSGFDTVLAVATGPSLSALQLVAANNNAGIGLQTSALRFAVTAGWTYYFVVDSANGVVGSGTVILNGAGALVGKPANDNFEQALNLSPSLSFSNIGSVLAATAQPNEPPLASQAATRSVWFSWTAPASGNLSLHTGGSDFANVLGIYSGTNFATLTLLQGKASPALVTNPVTVPVSAGGKYVIKVDGARSTNGTYRLTGQLATLPAPASVTFTNLSTSNRQVSPRIAWSPVAGSSHYQVEIWRTNTLLRGITVQAPTTNWNNGPALPRTGGFTARVRAFSNNLASDWTTAPAVFP